MRSYDVTATATPTVAQLIPSTSNAGVLISIHLVGESKADAPMCSGAARAPHKRAQRASTTTLSLSFLFQEMLVLYNCVLQKKLATFQSLETLLSR